MSRADCLLASDSNSASLELVIKLSLDNGMFSSLAMRSSFNPPPGMSLEALIAHLQSEIEPQLQAMMPEITEGAYIITVNGNL